MSFPSRYHPKPMWVRLPDAPEGLYERASHSWTLLTDPDPYEGYEKIFQGQKAIDVLGREVHVGDRIAVAVTVSRSANMRVGKVISIDEILTDDWSGEKVVKKGTGTYRIRCEWEASGWDQGVKTSAIEAGLPKYVKL